jgi:hypothetical protein
VVHFSNSNHRFKLTLKDPSFLNVRNPFFTFHFGKVSLRALVSCDTNNNYSGRKLCAHAKSESIEVDIGIENKLKKRLDDIEPEICLTRSLIHLTCIQKYGSKHYIIMQPSSIDFTTTIADINAYNLTTEQRKAYERAKVKGQHSFEYVGRRHKVSDIDIENIEKVMPDIELRSDQKLENGLIIKMIEYDSQTINYVSYLDKPSNTNKCIKEEDTDDLPVKLRKKLCFCNNKCGECYQNTELQVRYLAINEQRPSKTITCEQIPQYRAYDFGSAQMASLFHGKSPSSKQAFNVAPTICLSIAFEKGYYKVRIVFNDASKHAHSSLLNGTSLKYNLFKIEYKHLNVSLIN